jgi:hypothetical protein
MQSYNAASSAILLVTMASCQEMICARYDEWCCCRFILATTLRVIRVYERKNFQNGMNCTGLKSYNDHSVVDSYQQQGSVSLKFGREYNCQNGMKCTVGKSSYTKKESRVRVIKVYELLSLLHVIPCYDLLYLLNAFVKQGSWPGAHFTKV